MKNLIGNFSIWIIFLLTTFYSCQQEVQHLPELQGTVQFGGISLEFAPISSQGSRIKENSSWIHVFPNSADLFFINKDTGKEYVLKYNPNDFSSPYTITLPYGAYDYYSTVEGGVFSAFLPFEVGGEFHLNSQSFEISLEAVTEFGLVTVRDQYVAKASLSDGERDSDFVLDEHGKYWFLYVKGGTQAILNITESFQDLNIRRELNIVANRHFNFILKPKEGDSAIKNLILAQFELEEVEILLGTSSNFFEENGTIKCPEALPGEKGKINGHVYEAVDRVLLLQRIDEGADLTCLCTSLVTDMNSIFLSKGYIKPIGNIGTWDVSNVTTMESMFFDAKFNQPIERWDVSNVKNMKLMFSSCGFNQPIGNWNVSNVVNMISMFYEASFNQPIEDWDVSNVKYMNGMLSKNSFNQPIGDWDVSNVINMRSMFSENGVFNQPIGKWNVSNVTDMGSMFSESYSFNQPIGDWDVSNVTDMGSMFFYTPFNQNISSWCVESIASEPDYFSGNSLVAANKPVWGTCPE